MATAAAHTGAAVESQAGSENAGQAAAQASAEERLPTEAVSSGGELGPARTAYGAVATYAQQSGFIR